MDELRTLSVIEPEAAGTRVEGSFPKYGGTGFEELQSIFEAMEVRLSKGNMSRLELRFWERKASGQLEDFELDVFMCAPDEDENITIAEQRWRNIRAILLARMEQKSGCDQVAPRDPMKTS